MALLDGTVIWHLGRRGLQGRRRLGGGDAAGGDGGGRRPDGELQVRADGGQPRLRGGRRLGDQRAQRRLLQRGVDQADVRPVGLDALQRRDVVKRVRDLLLPGGRGPQPDRELGGGRLIG